MSNFDDYNFDFEKEDELYKKLSKTENDLLLEKNVLENKLLKVNSELKTVSAQVKTKRVEIIDGIEKLSRIHNGDKIVCTCETGLVNNDKYARYVKCLKHLSRHFQNKGCYWCGYTDCSKWNC
jgi:hypothetical protein